MGLTTKFNIALVSTSALALLLAWNFADRLLQQNARDEVLLQAGIMMEAASSIRSYTVEEIGPLLTMQMKRQFLPQTVPAYAATKNIRGMRAAYEDYTYKEAALNPTNPADRATDWEADIIEWFRNHPDQSSLIGERDAVNGQSLYLAKPIQITNPTCLACHSTPDQAPATLIERYGANNGFGWQLEEIIGAQIVSVPMSVPLARAAGAQQLYARSRRDLRRRRVGNQSDAVLHRHPTGQPYGRDRRSGQQGARGRTAVQGNRTRPDSVIGPLVQPHAGEPRQRNGDARADDEQRTRSPR